MSEQENQDSQKTVVAFIAGLLIGGLLVWVFSSPTKDEVEMDNATDDKTSVTVGKESVESENVVATDDKATVAEEETTPVLSTGKGALVIDDQPAGSSVSINSATFPNDEGWVGVRDYSDEKLTGLLGVARFSKEQGLVPSVIDLLRPTVAGQEYAVVFYTESGDREFSLANDGQLEDVIVTFKAE